jgi:hypothetical protein
VYFCILNQIFVFLQISFSYIYVFFSFCTHLKQVKPESMEKLQFVFLSQHVAYLQITNCDLQTHNTSILSTFLLMQLLCCRTELAEGGGGASVCGALVGITPYDMGGDEFQNSS